MDDELDRAAKKHRLQQRHGALRAQQRQRLQQEEQKAAFSQLLGAVRSGDVASSSEAGRRSRPKQVMRVLPRAQGSDSQSEWVPDRAICALKLHTRLISLLVEKLDLPDLQDIGRERGHPAVSDEAWQVSAGGGLYRHVALQCPLWQRLWSGLEESSDPRTFCLSNKEIRIIQEVELHLTCTLMHLGIEIKMCFVSFVPRHALELSPRAIYRPYTGPHLSVEEIKFNPSSNSAGNNGVLVMLDIEEPSFDGLLQEIQGGLEKVQECVSKLQKYADKDSSCVGVASRPRKGSKESMCDQERRPSLRKSVSFLPSEMEATVAGERKSDLQSGTSSNQLQLGPVAVAFRQKWVPGRLVAW
eukprot:s788_g9.t1